MTDSATQSGEKVIMGAFELITRKAQKFCTFKTVCPYKTR